MNSAISCQVTFGVGSLRSVSHVGEALNLMLYHLIRRARSVLFHCAPVHFLPLRLLVSRYLHFVDANHHYFYLFSRFGTHSIV